MTFAAFLQLNGLQRAGLLLRGCGVGRVELLDVSRLGRRLHRRRHLRRGGAGRHSRRGDAGGVLGRALLTTRSLRRGLRLRSSESDGASGHGRTRTERARAGPAAVRFKLLRAGKVGLEEENRLSDGGGCRAHHGSDLKFPATAIRVKYCKSPLILVLGREWN